MKNNLNWLPILALTCVVTLITVSYSYSSPRPFHLLKNPKNVDLVRGYFCDQKDGHKFARNKVIASINLVIGDFISKSGDAKYLNVNYGSIISPKDITSNRDLYESFKGSIKKYNSDKEYAQQIEDKKHSQIMDCLFNEQKKNPNDTFPLDKCNAKLNSKVEAKYGNALVRFECDLSIKGIEFPVLVKSKCKIKVGEKRFYHDTFNLTDINAFEETTIKQGLKRLLDEHVKNLSEVFEVAKMCK